MSEFLLNLGRRAAGLAPVVRFVRAPVAAAEPQNLPPGQDSEPTPTGVPGPAASTGHARSTATAVEAQVVDGEPESVVDLTSTVPATGTSPSPRTVTDPTPPTVPASAPAERASAPQAAHNVTEPLPSPATAAAPPGPAGAAPPGVVQRSPSSGAARTPAPTSPVGRTGPSPVATPESPSATWVFDTAAPSGPVVPRHRADPVTASAAHPARAVPNVEPSSPEAPGPRPVAAETVLVSHRTASAVAGPATADDPPDDEQVHLGPIFDIGHLRTETGAADLATAAPPPAPALAPTSAPAGERSVHVHIGAIEIHGEQDLAVPAQPQPSPVAAAEPAAGFEQFDRLRTYSPWGW